MNQNAARLVVLGIALVGQCVVGAEFYVAPDGSDAHAGTEARPWGTLQNGVNRLQPGDTLLVRGGVYRESVTFPRSGTAQQLITLKSYNGEKVTVSGCDPVSGWKRGEGNIWTAPMVWTLGLGRNQVFVENEVFVEARYPNSPAPGLQMYVSDLSPLWPTFGEFSIPQETRTSQPGHIVSRLLEGQPADYWKGALYYGVHYEGWCAQTGVIESSKSGEIEVTDRTQGWWFGSAYGGGYPQDHQEGRGMIVGHMNALDQPGEWHWQDGTLYLIPRTPGEPTGVEAKRRQLAFDLSDREHIRIEGLSVRAASLRLDQSANCVVDHCDLNYISHYTRQYTIGQIEHGRDTIKSGETGIYVSGHDNSFLNCSVRISAGAGFHLRGYHHTIHNCLIDEVSYTAHYLNAITDAVSDFADYENMLVGGHVITFNTMRNAGRHFFNFHGNGTSLVSRDRSPMDYMATLLAHNHMYNGMLQTRDAGLITGYYSSGGTLNGLNSQVAYNVLHDSYDTAAMRWNVLGIIYLDAGTCDVDLHHNLLWAAPGSLQRGLWYNTMCVDIQEDKNVFHPSFTRTCAELVPSDFPEGTPFRFGHDFDDPPSVPVWPPLVSHSLKVAEAVAGSAEELQSSGEICNVCDGDSYRFEVVDSRDGWQSAVLQFASNVRQINTDKSMRAKPRHRQATDPLVLEATNNDGVAEEVRSQWTFLYNTNNQSWVRFNQVPLGAGYHRFRAIYGNSSTEPRSVEARLDSPDGLLVGKVALPQTDQPRKGRIQIYGEAIGELSAEATGTHDLFFVFRSEDEKTVGEFEYFRLEQSRGELPLQRNEVRLELHAGSQAGPMIGQFYPRFTGGQDSFRQFVARLVPTALSEPLVLVVRSAVAGPIGTIKGLKLQKASAGGTGTDDHVSGIGAPCRIDSQGELLLPQATHRPCSRPADKYREEWLLRRGTRPLLFATRCETPPVVDGQLDEWLEARREVTLKEACDGSETAAPKSIAWVGYDDQALYVAARHTVKDVAWLRQRNSQSAPTDYMEIVFQDTKTSGAPIINLRGYPDGAFICAEMDEVPATLVGDLKSGTSYRVGWEADAWVCEWRVPLAACGLTPSTSPQLAFNLAARRHTGDTWAVWCGTGGAPRELNCAGRLFFPQEFAESFQVPRNGLAVWLDAADAVAVEKDESGKVAVWKDKSGKDRHAIQDFPEVRPLYVPTGMNGKSALLFHDVDKTCMKLPDFSDRPIAVTILAVVSNPEPGLAVNHNPRIFTASNGKEYDYLVGICCSVPGTETGGPRLIVYEGTDRWAKSVRVGCFSPVDQTFWNGSISEILVFDRVLSPEEQFQVRAYLSGKWDLR